MSPSLRDEIVKPMAALFLIFMGVLGVFTFGFVKAANDLRAEATASCEARNVNRYNSDAVLDKLISNAQASTAFKTAEKVDRIAGWAALRQPMEECNR